MLVAFGLNGLIAGVCFLKLRLAALGSGDALVRLQPSATRHLWLTRDLVIWGRGMWRREALYRGEVDDAAYAAIRRMLKAATSG